MSGSGNAITSLGSRFQPEPWPKVTMVIPTLNEARTLEGQPAPPGSVARRYPDLAKLRGLTGYEPTVSLEDGLRRTDAWYQAHWRQLS